MDRVTATYCLLLLMLCALSKVSSKAVETSEFKRVNPATSKNNTEDQLDDPLTYPTDPSVGDDSLNRGGTFTPSSCPNGTNFCESADDYPDEEIKKRLKKQPKILFEVMYEEELGGDNNRFGENEKELCTSTAKIVYPKKAQSKEGVYEFLVNNDEHKQGVRVETCISNGKDCDNMPADIVALGYKSECIQKYITRTLVVLNRDSSDVQGFVTKPFEFPSCCACAVEMTSYRFGGEITTTPAKKTAKPTTRTTKPNSRL